MRNYLRNISIHLYLHIHTHVIHIYPYIYPCFPLYPYLYVQPHTQAVIFINALKM